MECDHRAAGAVEGIGYLASYLATAPAAQEFRARRAHATVTEINASHLSLISHPGEVTRVIEEAARHTS